MVTPERIARWRRENPDRHHATTRRYRQSSKGVVACLWKMAKRRAQDREIEFSLTKAAIARKLPKGRCEMTGLSFVIGGKTRAFSPSLDRIDYRKGYTDRNVRLVLFAINAARGDWGDDVLLEITRAFVNKHITRG